MNGDAFKKIEGSFQLACAYILGFSACLMLAGIILREAFGISFDFISDFTVWLTVWAMFLIFGPLLGERAHIAIGFLIEKAQGKARLTIEFLNALCILLYTVAMAYGAIVSLHFLFTHNVVYPRYIPIPMWIIQLCVPVGFLVFAAYAVGEIFKLVKRARGKQA
ncbi:MAG: TRAP transporter small permease [Chloroflexi bacterium]|nr:TRAP transporter small permease [Chloroflexota bacterium]MBM3183355.1 TRAP transporter small permease [Chloroflexota bacterium]MBM4449550.1 TRAP transporter small permease [Chloroflexota bacterium]